MLTAQAVHKSSSASSIAAFERDSWQDPLSVRHEGNYLELHFRGRRPTRAEAV
jgi:hypothetical protein